MGDINANQILNAIPDMLFVMAVDARHNFRYVKMNPAAMRASGLNEYAYGATFYDVVAPEEASFLFSHYSHAIQMKKTIQFRMVHDSQVGESILNPVIDAWGNVSYVVGTVRDVTERFQREEALRREAHHDALTGLLNRHGLRDGIKTLEQDARQTPSLYAVFVIDVDDLKCVNDTYGHVVGDLFLSHVAHRLEAITRAGDLSCRTGGDEFLIIAKIAAESDTHILAERILQQFRAPWSYENHLLNVSISIGIATYPIDGFSMWDVVRTADMALYEAKNSGRGLYRLTSSRQLR
jgi:diguanylate cyclase (GGDEF)-like protein/PAS domain S-box-containing protein